MRFKKDICIDDHEISWVKYRLYKPVASISTTYYSKIVDAKHALGPKFHFNAYVNESSEIERIIMKIQYDIWKNIYFPVSVNLFKTMSPKTLDEIENKEKI